MDHEVILQVQNVYCKLLTNNLKLKSDLSKKLRFRPKNYFHNPAYKNKRWDGWKYFFSEKTGVFLSGILPEVLKYLIDLKVKYIIHDDRGQFQWLHKKIDVDFLTNSFPEGTQSVEMYDYQADLVNLCLKFGRGIIQAPTGAGKTYCLVSLLKCLPPKTPALFVTKNSQLVHQNWEEMKIWGVPDLGRWYDKYKEPNYVMCVTNHFKTFESIDKLLPKFKVLIVDEVHDCMSDVPMNAYKKMTGCSVRIGISATAFRWDKKKLDNVHKWNLKGHFGPILQTKEKLTTQSLQTRGILSKSKCYFYEVNEPNLKHETYAEAIKLGIEQNFSFHIDINKLVKTCKGRTLIVVERIEQGMYLNNLIEGSHFIKGEDSFKARMPVIESLRNDPHCVAIVMRQIITAGINVKVHDLINAAGGDGAHNIIQLIGRGLRTAKDKASLRYHDFLFKNNSYLQQHSEWRMEILKKEGHEVEVLPIPT